MYRLLAVGLVCFAQTGCSLLLDFSDSQIPIDAPPDVFSVAECDFAEPNDSFETAVAQAVGTPGSAALCSPTTQDKDFYKFTVPAATTTLTAKITFTTLSGDLDLYLYDATGVELARSVGNMDNETIVCPGATPVCALGMTPPIPEGDYVLEVRAATALQNTYTVDITTQ
jgi:hypothetical protein